MAYLKVYSEYNIHKMGALKNILSNWIVKNILLAIVALAAVIVLFSFALNLLTNHNRVITVPDLTGMTVEEAHRAASSVGVKTGIMDSVFVKRMARGAVFSQNPKAGERVKKGRRIFLTINSVTARKVRMPNLVGYSMRQAKAELNAKGLNLGKLIYVSDIATNNVLKQLYHNMDIRPGTSIESGSDIDLQVGLNEGENRTYVPDVVGQKYLRAVDVIHDNSLNVSHLNFDSSVKNYTDSLNAVVYRQSPLASQASILMGTQVSLSLTVNPSKIPASK
jgi:beta-lactam-binding protein with PASTA domain